MSDAIGTMTDPATGETLDLLGTWEDDRGRIVKLRAADGRVFHRRLAGCRVQSVEIQTGEPRSHQPSIF